jgi:uncharacterized iron-regulated protein
MRRRCIHTARAGVLSIAAIVMIAGCTAVPPPPAPDLSACPPPAAWIEPGTQRRLDHAALTGRLAGEVVLLGETHGVAAHHRWQLSMIAALHGRRPDMVLGFEAFPRGVQPVLDRWVRGELGPDAFLRAVDWPAIWGHEARYYLPMFAFARLHRVPMVALNVDRALVGRVSKEGWQGVPPDERSGIGDPAPPAPAYRRSLAREFLRHRRSPGKAADAPDDKDIETVFEQPAFRRFAEAQLLWDRAMAEALAVARRRPGAPLVVGVMGQGHLTHGHGTPHQLSALGITDVAVLLPRDRAVVCKGLPAGLADAVFVLGPDEESARPRPILGVRLETVTARVRIAMVAPDSVAAAAGLRAGDIIVEAAGRRMRRSADLVAIIRRQPPGTWLPLRIERKGRVFRVVAKFPAAKN